ncbi:hypothetical protein [Chromobacterium phragmitis]|uniref:DJ-1/PfpI domain-containing protein n=1 Tax=Chromobacterium phragmitis TaxID=2202141 RepID=A0A344UHR3_9NEIS|nr:hypothetical protein [Chromobacterium phragmitis]AXE34811.1 hypothetical protein DK843_11220 [Chromobacterium phragmitis]
MPKPLTLLTWVPQSGDGEREARKLHGIASDYCTLEQPGKLTTDQLSRHAVLIIVGHRQEFTSSLYESLKGLLSHASCGWLTLAMCSSAVAEYHGPLRDNELWSPAQRLANELRIKVSGTRRELGFDEVGRGYAFALAGGEILMRSDPLDSPGLWQDCVEQDDVEMITEGLANL